MKYLNIIILFLGIFFVAPILAQSLPRPIAGTLYAPVYVKATGEFVGWEGKDGTFITWQGQFFPSVNYEGISVVKLPCIYTVNFNVETFAIQYFSFGKLQISVDGIGLPSFSLVESGEYDPGASYEFENPEDEDYPMPSSGKDESGQFTQRVFLHLFPDVPYTSARASHLVSDDVRGYSRYVSGSGNALYYGAGVSSIMLAYYDYLETLVKPRVEVVSDPAAKDGFEFLVCEGIDTSVSYYVGKVFKVPLHNIVSARLNGVSDPVVIDGVSYNYVYQFSWGTVTYSDSRMAVYGNFVQALFKFYLRDQYQSYKTGVSYVAKLHKRKEGYEIWYFDRKYYAAGYSDSNSDGSGSDGSPPTLPSPPTELSGFKYFSKDEDGKYHLNISGVLNNFKTKLKENINLIFWELVMMFRVILLVIFNRGLRLLLKR